MAHITHANAKLTPTGRLALARCIVDQGWPLLQAIPAVRGRAGRPQSRARRLYADRAYDYDRYRRPVRAMGVTPFIARRGQPHGSGLGTTGGWPSAPWPGCTASDT